MFVSSSGVAGQLGACARTCVWGVWLLLVCAAIAGCATAPKADVHDLFTPSNDRHWTANQAVLPYARIGKDRVTVFNIRNTRYVDADTYIVAYYDQAYALDDVRTVDFIVAPFADAASLAHTMLSFGFRDGKHLAISVEARREEGEDYSPLDGAMHQYELIYIVADERDVIRLRTEHYKSDVYVYQTVATAEQARKLLVDVLERVNRLRKRPEFYDTLMNNCTTNLAAHINHLNPGRIPWNPTTLLTGYSDRLAYELGLLVDYGSFAETKRRARINALAERYADNPRFSQLIRLNQQDVLIAGRRDLETRKQY